jgi:hypothetical protein
MGQVLGGISVAAPPKGAAGPVVLASAAANRYSPPSTAPRDTTLTSVGFQAVMAPLQNTIAALNQVAPLMDQATRLAQVISDQVSANTLTFGYDATSQAVSVTLGPPATKTQAVNQVGAPSATTAPASNSPAVKTPASSQ